MTRAAGRTARFCGSIDSAAGGPGLPGVAAGEAASRSDRSGRRGGFCTRIIHSLDSDKSLDTEENIQFNITDIESQLRFIWILVVSSVSAIANPASQPRVFCDPSASQPIPMRSS